MASSAFKSVDLSKALVKRPEVRDRLVKEKIRLKTADVLRSSANLAIVNVEVDGAQEGLRFDLGKRVFLDSLGSKKRDAAVQSATEPIRIKIFGKAPIKGSNPFTSYKIVETETVGKSKLRGKIKASKAKPRAKGKAKA